MNKKKIIALTGSAAALIAFCFWQNNMLTVSDYTFTSPKVSAELDGFRIVQISDLHNKNFGDRLIRKISALEPDIIVITGDLVDANHTNLSTAETFAAEAAKLTPTYFITGNHEVFLDSDDLAELTDSVRAAGAEILDGSSVTVAQGGSSFILTGLADESLGYSVLTSMKLDRAELNVVLAHEPQFIADYAEGGADLVLTGHAHGGQFRIPFTGIGLVAPDQGFFPKYTAGSHTLDGTEMLISRGLGNSIIPLRLFNFPEIVTVELCKE